MFNQIDLFTDALGLQIPWKVYDSKERTWRHLNFYQYRAFIHCKVPRYNCEDHGFKPIDVPWTREGSGFTLLFEAFAMTLVSNMHVNAAAKMIGVYSERIWRIIEHSVEIAYAKVKFTNINTIGIDETSNKRGHDYITLFVDLDESKVIYATEGKDASTIGSFKETFESQVEKSLKLNMPVAIVASFY